MAITSLFKRKKSRAAKPALPVGKATEDKPVTKKVTAQEAAPVGKGVAAGRRVMLTPLVSEKGVDRQVLNQVVFRVTAHSTKGQISQAVQEEYGVRPIKIRTIRMHPKRRTRGRTEGFTAIWKKAYVTVADLKPFNVTP